ncbi:SubName: Full=Uncharacterized protein {ECO:0000313/EMBL:CCA70912.1} [Serendipita indica DSM 11827]|nr:SubName: Full=Uncharacterized protein {ECO:0000313/EMBL:CCA70912.1} [Serendipita indica DSM 11827]
MDTVVVSEEEQLRLDQQALVEQLASHWETATDSQNLQHVMNEYNETVMSLSALEKRRRVDPLSVLPVEIWSEIIKDVLPPSITSFLAKMKTLQQFMAVSTHWRRLIIHEPSFWTQIDTYHFYLNSKKFHTPLIKLCIERSQAAELSICGTFEDPAWEANLGTVITPHAHRIKEIILVRIYNRDSARATRLLSLFPITPVLKALTVQLPHDEISQDSAYVCSIRHFIHQNPQLTDIRGACHALLQPDSLSSLSRISLKCEATQAIPVLRKFPRLRSVTFHDLWPPPRPQPCDTNEPLPWTKLKYTQLNHGVGIFLIGLLRASLRDLHLKVDALHLRDFMEALGYLAVLEMLTLFLDLGNLSPLLLRSVLDEPVNEYSNVRKVDVFSTYYHRIAMDSRFGTDPETLWNWLLLRIPNTEALFLPFAFQSTMVSLTNLKKLRRFYCGSVILYHLREVDSCSSLQELNLQCGAVTFLMLSSETVRKLAITFTEVHPIEFLAFKWPSLTTLNLRLAFESTSEPITFHLPQLREIEVDGRLQPVTAVTRSLACDAHKVPCLEHILFPRWYPELDLLFILLERRLLSSDLKPLMRLTISKSIPSGILSLLVERIQGLFTARPTLFDLSVDVHAKAVLDTDM